MLQMLSDWVQTIVSLLLFLAFVQLLLPEHRLRDYTRLVLGLIVIAAVVTPLMSLLDPQTWNGNLVQALSVPDQPLRGDRDGRVPRTADAGPWIAQGVRVARLANEEVSARVRSVWEGQIRSLASLVPGVEEVDVRTRWDAEGNVDAVRLHVRPARGATHAVANVEASPGTEPALSSEDDGVPKDVADRLRRVVSDYFRLPP